MFSVNCGRKRMVMKRVAHGKPKNNPPFSAVLG
jgi:hypothetical protein